MPSEKNQNNDQLNVRKKEPWYEVLMDIVRLIVIGVLVGGGIYLAYSFIGQFGVPTKDGDERLFPGLSPAVGACYRAYDRFPSIVIATGFGMALGAAYIFGTFLYKKFRDSSVDERWAFWHGVSSKVEHVRTSELIEIIGGFREYEKLILERRNVYWGLFLRASLALLVVTVISLLIAECKIESQAGLPIITGIISFIIGQGADALHASGTSILYVTGNSTPDVPPGHDKEPNK